MSNSLKFHTYQGVYETINAVQSSADVEELRVYIEQLSAVPLKDANMQAHLKNCREALRVYDERLFRRWSTPFLQEQLAASKHDPSRARYADIYRNELRNRIPFSTEEDEPNADAD